MIKAGKIKTNRNAWAFASLAIIALILIPNINIFISIFSKPGENWLHIKDYLLKDYVINSSILLFYTGILTGLIGVSLAWIISIYEFPMSGFFKWGLILPLSIPSYIGAYTYSGILDYTGSLQSFLRNRMDFFIDQKYVDIMSLPGSIFIFTVFLFPYVYIICSSFFEKQSASMIENARILGKTPLEIFFRVALPISRASLVGGVSLVLLEVLNDYGVVKYFGVTTFSTAIFKTWFGMGDSDSAIRLSSILMIFVFSILFAEKLIRGRMRFSNTNSKIRPLSKIRLKGVKAALAFSYSSIFFIVGFLIPLAQIIKWSTMTYREVVNMKFIIMIFNSTLAAVVASVLVVVSSIIVANYCRISRGSFSKLCSRVTSLGYSIPGAVIAIGVIVMFIGVDKSLYKIYKIFNEDSIKLVLSTSPLMLLFAYFIRFLTIGYNSVESGFEKVGSRFFEASRSLGMGITETFFKVDLKMIKPAVISGLLLVFVDILKELPLTLILRPYNYNTLATRAFEYASDEMIRHASVPSLIIVVISIVSIYYFHIQEREEI